MRHACVGFMVNKLMTKKNRTNNIKRPTMQQQGTVLLLKVIPTRTNKTNNPINNSGNTQEDGYTVDICSDEIR